MGRLLTFSRFAFKKGDHCLDLNIGVIRGFFKGGEKTPSHIATFKHLVKFINDLMEIVNNPAKLIPFLKNNDTKSTDFCLF